jgi:molybdopterin/thiamine biosynthesis adenylyltransferase
MKTKHITLPATIVLLGAGLIGRHLGVLLARLPNVGRIRIVDRDSFTKEQAARPSEANRPKAIVLAERIRAICPKLEIAAVVADVESLPLGLFRCQVLLTALDSKRARMVANYAFGKLGIRYWIDSGVSAPSLVRISLFAQGKHSPCYECALDNADYASAARFASGCRAMTNWRSRSNISPPTDSHRT